MSNVIQPGSGSQPAEEGAPARTGRLVTASVIGTVFEFFDLSLYAAVAGLVFAKVFFPEGNSFVATIYVWSVFAVSYLMRPFGAIVFGHIGDKLGRKMVLMLTLVLMGGSTVLIGFLPTYTSIGVLAPVLMVVLRLVQGFAAGGEHGSATVMLIEHKNESRHRGFYAALPTAGSVLGVLMATGVIAIFTASMSSEAFEAWGWRIPFVASVIIVIIGLLVRRGIAEPPVLKETVEAGETVKVPFFSLFVKYPKQMLIALAPTCVIFFTYYISITVTVPYAGENGSTPLPVLLAMSTAGQALYAISIVSFAALSDRIGRKIPMLIGASLAGIWIFAYFPLLLSGNSFAAFIGFAGMFLTVGCLYGPLPALLSESFGSESRLSGMSFVYQTGGALSGGFAPLIATGLFGAFNNSWLPLAIAVAIGAALTVFAVSFSRETRNIDLATGAVKVPTEELAGASK